MIELSTITAYYHENKAHLHQFFDNITKNISGRVPHDSILSLKIISDLIKVENYLEIGVHNGGSTCIMCTNSDIRNIYGIDLFEDMYNVENHYNEDKFRKYQYFKRDSLSKNKSQHNIEGICELYNTKPNLHLIQGNTYFDETEHTFKDLLGDLQVDLIHLDGDHTAEGINNDFARYSQYLKAGGILVFDDYHHIDIKRFVDGLGPNNGFIKIGVFKSDSTKSEQFIICKQ
tara:strand:- start:3333 stop:4025 length:693 start_codon:yes stop_codon:yes gene_type:complete